MKSKNTYKTILADLNDDAKRLDEMLDESLLNADEIKQLRITVEWLADILYKAKYGNYPIDSKYSTP
jgi:hypothetical protein